MEKENLTATERLANMVKRMFGKHKVEDAQPIRIHPKMDPELRVLAENFDRAARELHKYCSAHDSGKNEETEPENYFAFQFIFLYNDGENSIVRNMTHLNGKDQAIVLKAVMGNFQKN